MPKYTGRSPARELPVDRITDGARLMAILVDYDGGLAPDAMRKSADGVLHLDLDLGRFNITLKVDGRCFGKIGDWGWHTLGAIMRDMAASDYQVHCCLTCKYYEPSRMVDEWSLGAEGYCLAAGEPDMENLTHMLHGCGQWIERGHSESWFGGEFTQGLTPEIRVVNSAKKGGTVSYETGHKLSDEFMHDLAEGKFHPILKRVQDDDTLLLEIRKDYVSIYYRGVTLSEITRKDHGAYYDETFNLKYYGPSDVAAGEDAPSSRLTVASDVDAFVRRLPRRKQAMDLHFHKYPEAEREVQQAVVRANNCGKLGRATDYYFCDIEYKSPLGEFDMIGVCWPSTPVDRKKCDGHRLVLAELKHGDGAIAGKTSLSKHVEASLSKHVEDINRFLEVPERVRSLKAEMAAVFNQQRELGLIDCDKNLVGFGEEPPLLLLLLSDHDPAKRQLRKELDSLDASPNVDIRFATASFMGYGIFEEGILTKKELYERCGWHD